MEFFANLNGISPWWWVAFGIALGAVEMMTMSFFLIWPGLAALLLAVLLALVPGLGGEAQIAIYAGLAMALTFLGRSLMHRYGNDDGTASSLNSRANLMIGRHAEVQEFTGPEGAVVIDGVRWHAIWPEGATATPGSMVEINGANGMSLLVAPEKG